MPFEPERLLDVIGMIDPQTGDPILTAEQIQELEQQVDQAQPAVGKDG